MEEYLVTPVKANEETVQTPAIETVEPEERETISPILFVPLAEESELDESGAGNVLNCFNGDMTVENNRNPPPSSNNERG